MPKLKIVKDEVVFDGDFMKMIRRHFRGSSGVPGKWEMVERKTHGRIVAVVPVTSKNEVVLVKSYRVPLKRYVIEFCAGLTDKKGESELSVAKRELLEETGYRAQHFQKLTSGPYNTGLSTDELVVYLATGAERVQKPELENGEDIEVMVVPLKKMYHLLAHPPRGVSVDIKLFGILYFLKKRGYNC